VRCVCGSSTMSLRSYKKKKFSSTVVTQLVELLEQYFPRGHEELTTQQCFQCHKLLQCYDCCYHGWVKSKICFFYLCSKIQFSNMCAKSAGTCTQNKTDDCLLRNGTVVIDCNALGPDWVANTTDDCAERPPQPTTECPPSKICDIIYSS